MPQERFKSIEEWKRKEQDRRREAASRNIEQRAAPSGGAGKLRVELELAPHADPTAIRQCRSIVLAWLKDEMGCRLPRKALRHRPFSLGGDGSACRAARSRTGVRDYWAAQLERSSGAGQVTTTEVIVGRHGERPPTVGIEVVDRSVVPADASGEYPAGMLAAMAERVPLLQHGRALGHRPIVVDTAETMHGFHRMLVDPERDMPFAVVSVPPGADDTGSLRAQWRVLAHQLTGLAFVWALPPAMTYRLSDLVGKQLSVFLGAWRLYRPGFDHRARRTDHPLFLKNRMEDQRTVAEVTRQFLLMAAEERMRAGADSALPFDYRTLVRETGEAVSGPARLVAFLRGTLGGRPAQPPEYQALPGGRTCGRGPAADGPCTGSGRNHPGGGPRARGTRDPAGHSRRGPAAQTQAEDGNRKGPCARQPV